MKYIHLMLEYLYQRNLYLKLEKCESLRKNLTFQTLQFNKIEFQLTQIRFKLSNIGKH